MSEIAGSDSALYARSFADVYDDWYGDLDDPAHLVAALSNYCQLGDTIVELGSGTGRLALPLHQSGFRILAIDVSMPMLSRAVDGPHRIAADMTQLPVKPSSAAAVVIAYNTLFNVSPLAAQQQCLQTAADTLRPGGVLALEAFIAPTQSTAEFGMSTRSHPTEPDVEMTIVTGPHPTAPDVLVGSHIERGQQTICRPWHVSYQSPEQLDACSDTCGLQLIERSSDWSGSLFDDESPRHVSWYQRA